MPRDQIRGDGRHRLRQRSEDSQGVEGRGEELELVMIGAGHRRPADGECALTRRHHGDGHVDRSAGDRFPAAQDPVGTG
ncbi:MAG: hypothetical protein IPH86_10015 [bacterium]|nr:hypothetical protein [bacterium]